MNEETMTDNAPELFQLKSGQLILSEELSQKMFTIQNTTPYSSNTRPTRIKISVTRSIPAESDFKVYVCNNGNDSSPTWEEATSSVTGGLVHIFENETKTAASWGVVIKVVVTRGEGEGACYVSQIGGNFE